MSCENYITKGVRFLFALSKSRYLIALFVCFCGYWRGVKCGSLGVACGDCGGGVAMLVSGWHKYL